MYKKQGKKINTGGEPQDYPAFTAERTTTTAQRAGFCRTGWSHGVTEADGRLGETRAIGICGTRKLCGHD